MLSDLSIENVSTRNLLDCRQWYRRGLGQQSSSSSLLAENRHKTIGQDFYDWSMTSTLFVAQRNGMNSKNEAEKSNKCRRKVSSSVLFLMFLFFQICWLLCYLCQKQEKNYSHYQVKIFLQCRKKILSLNMIRKRIYWNRTILWHRSMHNNYLTRTDRKWSFRLSKYPLKQMLIILFIFIRLIISSLFNIK